MGDVHVPTDDDGLLRVELPQVGAEGVLPGHAVVDALEAVLRVGRIDADEKEALILQRHGPALGVVLGDSEVIAHGQRRVPREDRGSGVALLLGVAPVALVAGKTQVDLPGLELGLLNTEKVCVQCAEYLLKALAPGGAQAVHIPGYEFHSLFSPLPAR